MGLIPRRLSSEELQQWQPRLWAKLIGLVCICVYVIAFVLENRKHVQLHFVLFTAVVSLIWLILLGVAFGIVAGVLVSQLYRRRRRH